MTQKRPIRDLERQLKREPDNLALRLTLAAGYREAGRAVEALALYRSVAIAYAEQGRATQATAVCRSALELAPEDGQLFSLLRHLEHTTAPPPPQTPPADGPVAPGPMLAPVPRPAPRQMTEPPLRPALPRMSAPPAPMPPPPMPPPPASPAPAREDNPMLATVKRVPPPPPALRPLLASRASSSELDTPLPPPLPLHDARDSVVEMPPLEPVEDPETVIALTQIRGRERPSAADFAAEMVTRRRPKLSPRDLEVLDLSPSDSAVTEARPTLPQRDASDTEPVTAEQGVLDDDEPTTPPARTPGASDEFSERGGTFERSFDHTLAQLDPEGVALEGPLGVFAMLPAEAGAELARRAVMKPYDPGEVVIREGDLGSACYIVVRGEVIVRKRGADGVDVELARLGEGALFGEFALLADRRRHATVVAAVDTELYEIPRPLLRELAAAFPTVGPALESFYRERLLSNLLLTTPLFALVPPEHRPALLARFQPIHVESGAAVVRQGERAGGLYLIVLGAVEVIRDLGLRSATVLASLGEGAYFGEMSLLSGDVASASVIAAGPCELAMLPPRAFYDVVSGNPALWTAMRGEAEARRLANAQILAGRTGVI